ncbi:MAG: type II toxin-antitoxin system PemK/MazF family toxin [Patescibacteria group bacterium]
MARLSKTEKLIKRGDIWTVDLRPGAGCELAKIRPALIVSNDTVNVISPTAIIIPISSQIPPFIGPDRVFVSKKDLALSKDSVILCGQIRSIDKVRLKKKIGTLPKTKLHDVEEAIRLIFNLG